MTFHTPELRYDRGTLKLTGIRREQLEDEVSEGRLDLRWDARVDAYRAEAYLYRYLLPRLREIIPDLRDSVLLPPRTLAPWPDLNLRPYQLEALEAWRSTGGRGIVTLPTGAGKTHVALAAMAKVNARSLVLVPTRVLLEQWHSKLSSTYRGEVGQIGDGRRRLAPVTVATYESGVRNIGELGNAFEFVVVDEAHHTGGYLRAEALALACAPWRLGLTATPREDEESQSLIRALLGPVVHKVARDELTGTYLAEFDRREIQVDLTPDERAHYDSESEIYEEVFASIRLQYPGANWQLLTSVAQRTAEGRRALVAWRSLQAQSAYPTAKRDALARLLELHRGARLIVFTRDNASAYAISKEFLIAPITCDIKRAERTHALERFASGELSTLVSSQVLNEGMDVPSAEIAIIVGGALGKREHIQRIGRMLRPQAGKRALIYELVTRNTREVFKARRRNEPLDVA